MSEVETRFKTPRLRSKAHLHFVSWCGCAVPICQFHISDAELAKLIVMLSARWKPEPNPYVTWHHVRRASNAGTAVKPGDDDTVGACDAHHKAIHQDGEKTCSALWGIDLMEKAKQLAVQSRGLGILK